MGWKKEPVAEIFRWGGSRVVPTAQGGSEVLVVQAGSLLVQRSAEFHLELPSLFPLTMCLAHGAPGLATVRDLTVEAIVDPVARRTFRYSIAYLALLFAALLVDHYL